MVADSDFYYIAGYTSNGFPYGITWEQYEQEYKELENDQENIEDNNMDEDPFW